VFLGGKEHPITAVPRRARRRHALREGNDPFVLRKVLLSPAVQSILLQE
jgi:hypothetical protein